MNNLLAVFELLFFAALSLSRSPSQTYDWPFTLTSTGGGIAQLAEHLSEKPATVLMLVRVHDAAREIFSKSQPPVQTLTIPVQPPVCNHMHQHLCTC